jgi:hypothetical protein
MKCNLSPFFLGALLTVHLTAVLTSLGPGYQTDDILRFIEVKVKKLNKHMKLREKLRGNGVLASLAWGKFEELYEIEEIRQIFEKEGDFSKVY